MSKIEEVVFQKTGKKFELENVEDGILVVFVCKPDSEFAKKQLPLFKESNEELTKKGISVVFLSDVDSKSEYFLHDKNREIINLSESLQAREEVDENLLIFTKKGSEIDFCELKELPENEYNWLENFGHFANNYNDEKEPEDKLWKWGQVVPEDGEWLCVDCGYIEEIKGGATFPICVVCLSGEVDGPTGPEGGYWERV